MALILSTFDYSTANNFQTEEQYLFVYEVLLEAYLIGNTQVSARNLKEHIQCLETSHVGGLTNMEAEFKVSEFIFPVEESKSLTLVPSGGSSLYCPSP